MIYAISFLQFLTHDLWHPLHQNTPSYGFWSGIAGSFVLGGGIWVGSLAMLRHHNCEVHRCWRLARHLTAAGHRVCRRHHPDDHLTPEKVHADHRIAQRADRIVAEPMGRTTDDDKGDW